MNYIISILSVLVLVSVANAGTIECTAEVGSTFGNGMTFNAIEVTQEEVLGQITVNFSEGDGLEQKPQTKSVTFDSDFNQIRYQGFAVSREHGLVFMEARVYESPKSGQTYSNKKAKAEIAVTFVKKLGDGSAGELGGEIITNTIQGECIFDGKF